MQCVFKSSREVERVCPRYLRNSAPGSHRTRHLKQRLLVCLKTTCQTGVSSVLSWSLSLMQWMFFWEWGQSCCTIWRLWPRLDDDGALGMDQNDQPYSWLIYHETWWCLVPFGSFGTIILSHSQFSPAVAIGIAGKIGLPGAQQGSPRVCVVLQRETRLVMYTERRVMRPDFHHFNPLVKFKMNDATTFECLRQSLTMLSCRLEANCSLQATPEPSTARSRQSANALRGISDLGIHSDSRYSWDMNSRVLWFSRN